ncbi:hypothetical protein B0T25DRAFT_132176 [Lasiosphaeria hispida]|uniref:Uncharacterized protein n=1 Tax=Lasiosphaeria hispida TaxID=260671 RepID=A0AAJ0MJ29_9PEZI|nr:hypothetical protein B0T25DRAFT_132176 [Lasiosphaeria hispida]
MASDDLSARLAKQDVDLASCVSAMRGEQVPWALGSPLTQLCLIRGIRYRSGFAEELQSATPALSRAWNARRIMSNVVPDMAANPEHVPYCIWHPDVASESTYRCLVQRYPHMRYQVARACAVAGYVNLYRELDVLPEVHVAEEARDNGNLAIFQDVMAAPVRYSVMDDYHRTVKIDSPRVAFLNGDTAVRSTLERKRKIQMPRVDNFLDDLGMGDSSDDEAVYVVQRFKPGYFNITEDGYIDTYDGYLETPARPAPDMMSPLLYSPLPQDLPVGNKDVLILMAAYYGDVDRYARLRRPIALTGQIECVMRGIFHNTLFAKWWADRLADGPDSLDGMTATLMRGIRKGITARFIMNNDLGRVTKTTPADELPYCIWYPGRPGRETLKELVRRRPDMRQQAGRACIVAGFTGVFDELDPEPDAALLAEADKACDPHFAEFLQKKMEQAGPEFSPLRFTYDSWKMLTRDQIQEPMLAPTVLWREVDEQAISVSVLFPGIYEGFGVDTGALELSVSARDTMLKDGQDRLDLDELYAEGT